MSTHERLRALRATRELGGLSKTQLRSLLPHLDEVCVAAGTQLALAGRPCHQFWVVAAGSLEACRHGRPDTIGPGGAFGWQAMRERGVNDATVTAVSAAHLLVMSHQQFRAVDGLAD